MEKGQTGGRERKERTLLGHICPLSDYGRSDCSFPGLAQLADEAFADSGLQQPKLGCSRAYLAQGPVASRWAAGSGIWSSRHTDVPATLGFLPASSSP